MKLEGSAEVKATVWQVWKALTDPQVLARCLPGCEKLEAAGDNRYTATMQVGLGSVKASYSGQVHLADVQPPSRIHMKVEGRGGPGFLKGEGTLELQQAADGTAVRYAGDVTVGGLIAGVGQRLITATARLIVGQFFAGLEKEAQRLEAERGAEMNE